MASLADATGLTLRLHTLTGELHREATDPNGDFIRMIQLADDASELADGLAVVFERTNAALEEALARWPISASVAEPEERHAPQPIASGTLRRAWARLRKFFAPGEPIRRPEEPPRQPPRWHRERPHPELLLLR